VDSITHVALGAIVGEAIAGKKLGKRALFLGAIAQSIPDIDFLAAFWLSPADNLLAHRGFTHSILFGVIATGAMAVIAQRLHRPQKVLYREWILFFSFEIFLHLLLDVCNAYGVGLLEPFSAKRFSFHVLYVADPFYSIWLGIALAALMIIDSKNIHRRRWIYFGVIASSAYFLHALTNKVQMVRGISAAMEVSNINHNRILTTPTPLNSWLWFVAVEADSGFHVTHRSTFDNADEPFHFVYFPKKDSLLLPFRQQHEVVQLMRFSQGYYTVEEKNGFIVFNDLRFGQITGWHDPHADFVFHYYINNPDENLLVIQRGRFSNWNKETFGSMVERIKGN
jgi:inner membrane protein